MIRKGLGPAALVGLLIIWAVPTGLGGTAIALIRLADAVGLAVSVPSWLYLSVLAVRLRKRRG